MGTSLEPRKLLVRCYAEEQGGQWVAVCVDFNLAAQGDSLAEAKSKLHEQISWYAYDALAGDDRAFASQLLNRKAPLSLVMRYHAIGLLSHLDGLKARFQAFCDPLPLAPFRPTALA